jgi:16S rRNA (cytosine967-C5)-methyltransferase
MADIAPRAMRAGVQLDVVTSPENHAPYDLVLIDAPCTGSGSWRRDPQGKWALSAAKLQQTLELQAEILAKAAPLVGPGGVLAYATCSVLKAENADQVSAFLQKNSDWRLDAAHIYLPNAVQDGFYLANLRKN